MSFCKAFRRAFVLFLLGIQPAVADPMLADFEYPFEVKRVDFTSQKLPLSMAYLDVAPQGAANGETVVLLHGKNFCAATWEDTIKALSAAGYRVVAPDQIGFCKSSKPEHYQFSFQQLASNTRQLLQQVSVEHPIIMGHSTGGMLAFRYVLMYPQETKALVAVNPIGLEDWKAKGAPLKTIDQLYQGELKTTADSIREYERKTYYTGGRPRQHREMVAKLRENADWIADAILAIIQKGLAGKLTNSDKILSQHIWETWQAMFGRHPQSVLLTGGLDVGDNPADMETMGGLTALLRAVRRENQPKQPEEPRPPPPDPAIAALTQAEREIPSFAVMLAQVRAESPDGEPASHREVLASLVGEERAAELIGEAVIVVDSAGTAVAAKPATAPRQAASVADEPAGPEPAAEGEPPKAEPPPAAPPPKPAREPRRPSGFPDFDRFSAERARTRAADEERARKVEEARAQGRPQISREESFPPDPREGPEVVRFTLAPGGRIRRVAG
jgi:pimeloyl-ACP methyl ester carboxylesterase